MSAKYTITDLVSLPNSDIKIPRLGFGVYRAHGDKCFTSVQHALKVGYRHIDTAQFYQNESEVGEALRKSGLPRSEVFVTTKIMSPGGSPEATYEKILESVEKIGGKDGYVDLFLIHSSSSGAAGRKELWQALERLLEEGKTKSIGVSNYGVKHIEEMKAYAKVWPPHVNQIEVSFLLLDICSYRDSPVNQWNRTASPVVPAACYSGLLQEAWDCRRGLFTAGAELQSQRSDISRTSAKIRKDNSADLGPLRHTEGMGSSSEERRPWTHCRQC